jgi:MOSC domain-containing protein YiiM/catechol 2,3-dioxygenase-like lactoylglutathione lyase family enzyme
MPTGRIHQINASRGGVPKLPLLEAAVTVNGLAGDRQATPGIHGGPQRALCLFPLEVIEALAAEGHPIAPGTTGENVTTAGLDWSAITPGARLRLGDKVVIRITSFTDPCRTIAGSFADGNMNRINQGVAPGMSRVYAQVLAEGAIRPGDPINLEAPAPPADPLPDAGIRVVAQVSLPVRDLERSTAFYRDALGATFLRTDPASRTALLEVGAVRLLLDASAGGRPGLGTVYFGVEDVEGSYRTLRERGIHFVAAPWLQVIDGVETWTAHFHDPDGNSLALINVRQR